MLRRVNMNSARKSTILDKNCDSNIFITQFHLPLSRYIQIIFLRLKVNIISLFPREKNVYIIMCVWPSISPPLRADLQIRFKREKNLGHSKLQSQFFTFSCEYFNLFCFTAGPWFSHPQIMDKYIQQTKLREGSGRVSVIAKEIDFAGETLHHRCCV